jgi:hypothetical protein
MCGSFLVQAGAGPVSQPPTPGSVPVGDLIAVAQWSAAQCQEAHRADIWRCFICGQNCSRSHFYLWLFVQNSIQQRGVHFEASVVVDVAQLPKPIHKVAHAGARRADHVLAEIRQQEQSSLPAASRWN